MLHRILARSIACAVGLIVAAQSFAQEVAEEEPFLPSLIAEYRHAGIEPVQKLEPVIAGNWADRPDERLLPGTFFTVTYRGLLIVPDDGMYQLHLHGSGDAQIKLNGKIVSPTTGLKGWESSTPQTLSFGPLPLEVTFTATAWPARISLFWSSDRFEREPIPARALAHDRNKTLTTEFERGRVLARALRCAACHEQADSPADNLPAPALDQLAGNMHRDWLVDWLHSSAHQQPKTEATISAAIERRMPCFSLPAADAELLADWLLTAHPVKDESKSKKPEKPAKPDPKKPTPSREAGDQLLFTRGCLACHRVGEFGESGLFGGGDLSAIAVKRPADYFAKWLQDPARLNRDHRMPVFDLTADERASLALALAARGKRPEAEGEGKKVDKFRARELASQHRCDRCHRLPAAKERLALSPIRVLDGLNQQSDWRKSCAAEVGSPKKTQVQYQLPKSAASALQTYFTQRRTSNAKAAAAFDGAQLLIENNCLACHAREPQPAGVLPKKFGDKLVQLAVAHDELAPQIPAMTPPSLNSVGDKLTDQALANAITRAGPAHRPYLLVQMPKFRLSKEQTTALSSHFIDTDRIPDYERTGAQESSPTQLAARALAGKRLVGTDGFSCTACHQVGSVQPVKAPPNARGPTLSMPQERLRKTWFDRWCRNPARIVPRMEMPSVQVPVRGVLQDNLHDQMAAVWQVLSTPGFEPPLPGPVRVLRFYSSEDNKDKQPLVVTDLIEHEGQTLERAMLVGLPNRQNILFDFATNRLLAWSQGDLARQRTKGKNWYWEPAGSALLTTGLKGSELALEIDGEMYEAITEGQWLAEPSVTNLSNGLAYVAYYLSFRRPSDQTANPKTIAILVQHFIEPHKSDGGSGLRRRYQLTDLPPKSKLHWRLLAGDARGDDVKPKVVTTTEGLTINLGETVDIQVAAATKATLAWQADGTAVITPTKLGPDGKLLVFAEYTSTLPADEYHAPRVPSLSLEQPPVVIAPGFVGDRMTLPADIMPTALAWGIEGTMFVASLKGQVLAFDRDAQKSPRPLGKLWADGLAAPYGLQAGPADFSAGMYGGPAYLDVATKYALLRITRSPAGGSLYYRTLASGWGYTADYHDWCVGLPRDVLGRYYLALPCYQDNRPAAAQRLRGTLLMVSPEQAPFSPHHSYTVKVISRGHRFPMGMALDANDELFVSDNQGNYNPFNELNWVQPGKHFGFVNKGEEKPKELTSPAIDIPHPWTRSVNGICFLNTPKALGAGPLTGVRGSLGKNLFGPLEGQLVGCEYDTRRLIRMSLQKVGNDYQGCCYPLTVPTPADQAPLGPVCCEISPAGDLTIGSIRDSGWGAGNNIGEVIRVKFDAEKLGHGLAEMRATIGGFELHFFQPVDEHLATDIANYSLSSYRRESTPAYGGNDLDRRTEKVAKATLSPDRKRVTLALDSLRAGHVYELRLKSLAADGAPFFPAEAHYTLRQLVK